MGRIADVWNSLSTEERLAELRHPTGTRAKAAPPASWKTERAAFIATLDKLLVKVRREAMQIETKAARTALVDGYWKQLRSLFNRAGVSPETSATIRRVFYSETADWEWFGERTDYPPGEGE